MDVSNPVVKLCAQGMEEEGKGNVEEVAELFARAWAQSSNDFESCIAAHYVARHQPTPELTLHWNQLALDCAHRVQDSSVDEFFPSLYLNLGKSLEDLGSTDQAREMYEHAGGKIICLPAGAYRDIIQDGIRRGLVRVSNARRSG